MNKTLSYLIQISFEENNSFNSSLKEIFCDSQCNNERYNCSFILPYSIHNAILKYFILVKKDGKNNEKYYDFITKCIFIFPCLPEKDVFMEIYKNLFCDRVLKENITDFLYEEFILEQLKINCGIDYVSGLEEIIVDLKKQGKNNEDYKVYEEDLRKGKNNEGIKNEKNYNHNDNDVENKENSNDNENKENSNDRNNNNNDINENNKKENDTEFNVKNLLNFSFKLFL